MQWPDDLPEVPWFGLDGCAFEAKCYRVYDGDTVEIAFDARCAVTVAAGSNPNPNEDDPAWRRARCRLRGIDTAEIRGASSDAERAWGERARDALREKLARKRFVWVRCCGAGKYGRWLVDLYATRRAWLAGDFAETINAWMIARGYAYAYDGKSARTPFDRWYKGRDRGCGVYLDGDHASANDSGDAHRRSAESRGDTRGASMSMASCSAAANPDVTVGDCRGDGVHAPPAGRGE